MATDFAVFLRRFLTAHLAGLRGCSPNTIASYRDAFKLLICYFRDERAIPPEKLTLDRIDAAAITGFLDWLEASRHNSASTRNQRLAAISSFFAVDADPGPGPDGLLPGHPRDPRQASTTRPAVAPPDRRADPPPARRSPTGPPGTAAATRPCSPPSTTPPPGSKNSPTSPSATSAWITPPWPP